MSVSPERIEEALAWAQDALKDERWVEWALERSADGNEGALVQAYQDIVAFAAALRGAQAENERLLERAEKAESEATDWQYACEESQASEADLMAEAKQMRERIRHVVNDSPGTPESVKQYLRAALDPADEAKP